MPWPRAANMDRGIVMALILTIENETSLPNGSPVSVMLNAGEGLDIGRSNLGWSLPDDTRFISGKHCEVRHRDDGYWLYDVSTNGTFVNDEQERLQGARRLSDGDRIVIGPYVILIAVEGERGRPPEPEPDLAEPPPVVVTEVAVRAADSAFGLEFDRPPPGSPSAAAVVVPSMPFTPVVVEEVQTPRRAIFRPGKRPPGPLALPLEDEDPVPVWANLAGGTSDATAPAALPPAAQGVSASGDRELRQPDQPPFPAPEAAAGVAQPAKMPRAAELQGGHFDQTMPLPTPKAETTPQMAGMATFGQPLDDRFAAQAASQDRFAGASPQGEAIATGDDTQTAAAFIQRFAQGAGLPVHIFARRDPLEVAEELGVLMHLVADNLKQLLNARHEAKRFTRSGGQTLIQALDNNPLKFAPTSEDALKIMLGPRTKSYLDARRTLETAFQDLKAHQISTFSAMQGAVKMLVGDIDPQDIDAAAGSDDSGLSGWLGQRKNRLWDIYLSRWQAKTQHHSDGIVGAFMFYFAECYDQQDD
jgi:type VI secretion system protein ImpI